jgi:hypothetical protein
LRTGHDEIIFAHRFEGERMILYGVPSISSRYVMARRSEQIDGHIIGDAIVARPLSDLSGPDIVVDEAYDENHGQDSYDEWVCWRRRQGDIYELVLANIETGEQRVIDDGRDGTVYISGIWGDRVVWGVSSDVLKEHRISTGVTREVIRGPDLGPMYGTTVWESYAVYNQQRTGVAWGAILVDLETGEARRVSPPDSRIDQASIHGGRIVWTGFRGGMGIVIYSIASGRSYVLNSCGGIGSEPAIFDRTVIWQGIPNATAPEGIWVTRIGDI